MPPSPMTPAVLPVSEVPSTLSQPPDQTDALALFCLPDLFLQLIEAALFFLSLRAGIIRFALIGGDLFGGGLFNLLPLCPFSSDLFGRIFFDLGDLFDRFLFSLVNGFGSFFFHGIDFLQ